MDIRNVQRTGKMHYVYLPTTWCKTNNISGDSKIILETNRDGTLKIFPQLVERKPKKLNLKINEDDEDIIHKLIIACYMSPASAFKIQLEKNIDYTKLLNQKKLVSLELVELSKDKVICESSVIAGDTASLIRTMIRKIRNLFTIMLKNYDKELIEKYEEEIDRNRLLVEKSVIGSLTHCRTHKLKNIDLYYIGTISRNLENIVDLAILLDKKENKFITKLTKIMDNLKKLMKDISNEDNPSPNYKDAIKFTKEVSKLEDEKVTNVSTYIKKRIKTGFSEISETIMDWGITKELEK